MDVNRNIAGALMKATMLGFMLNQYYERPKPGKHKGRWRIPEPVVKAAVTAFTINVVSVFDEGLDYYLTHKYPKKRFSKLGVRIAFLKSKQELLDAENCELVVELRNTLAHERDVFATGQNWSTVLRVVKAELKHLRVIFP